MLSVDSASHTLELREDPADRGIGALVSAPGPLEPFAGEVNVFDFVHAEQLPAERPAWLAVTADLEGAQQLVPIPREAIDMRLDHPMTPVVPEMDQQAEPYRGYQQVEGWSGGGQ
jgi:hypothetical protein